MFVVKASVAIVGFGGDFGAVVRGLSVKPKGIVAFPHGWVDHFFQLNKAADFFALYLLLYNGLLDLLWVAFWISANCPAMGRDESSIPPPIIPSTILLLSIFVFLDWEGQGNFTIGIFEKEMTIYVERSLLNPQASFKGDHIFRIAFIFK